jgi:hypothetical protein
MPIFADARQEAFVFLSVSSNILKIDKMITLIVTFGRIGSKAKGKYFGMGSTRYLQPIDTDKDTAILQRLEFIGMLMRQDFSVRYTLITRCNQEF